MHEETIDVVETLQKQPSLDQEFNNKDLMSSSSLRAASLAAAAALAACGGDGGGTSSGSSGTPDTVMPGRTVTLSATNSTQLAVTDDAQVSRFLQQAQFAATDADIAAVKSKGYKKWLEDEMAKSYGLAWEWLNRQGYSDVGKSDNNDCDNVIWSQLLSTNDVFRKRAALALSEILVVSTNGLNFNWRTHAITHYWDTLCINAFGNYIDLLKAITLNVAMGYYLNTKGSVSKTGVQPDENFAREVMQLFTIGLVELDDGGNPVSGGQATYGAADVSALAHVYTGWDIDQKPGSNDPEFTRKPMKFDKNRHSSKTRVTALNGLIDLPMDMDGVAKLNTALEKLVSHPNTAPFVCKRLIQRLVTSNPSYAYVSDVAKVFRASNGDLARVFGAILLHDDARKPVPKPVPAEFGKLREPMVRLVQWARTFGVRSNSGRWQVGDLSDQGSQLGQSPLRAPSVFNFFKPGYAPPFTSLSPGTVAPEFQLVNETSVSGYLNYIMTTIKNGVSGSNDMQATYAKEQALALSPTQASPSDLVQRLNVLLCGGQLSPATAGTITTVVGKISVQNIKAPTENEKKARVYAAVLMVMACAEYLIQK